MTRIEQEMKAYLAEGDQPYERLTGPSTHRALDNIGAVIIGYGKDRIVTLPHGPTT